MLDLSPPLEPATCMGASLFCLLPLPFAYCLLPITFCLLRFAYCLLPMTFCLLPCLLPLPLPLKQYAEGKVHTSIQHVECRLHTRLYSMHSVLPPLNAEHGHTSCMGNMRAPVHVQTVVYMCTDLHITMGGQQHHDVMTRVPRSYLTTGSMHSNVW